MAGTLFGGIHSSDAAQATASIGATIDNGGGVGVPDPDPTPEEIAAAAAKAAAEAAAIVEAVATAASKGKIVVPPVTPGTKIGFGSPAPVAAASDAAAAAEGGDGGPVISDGANELPRASRPFSRDAASNIAIGTRTSVGVSGRPNQTYSVILPGQTIYSKDGNIISLNDFQHNGGFTPSMDGRGGDIFSIGASVVTVPIGEESFIRTRPGNNTDQAATTNGTTAEANPFPSIQDIIAGTDGLSTNENQRREILAAAFTARSPFVNIVVSYN